MLEIKRQSPLWGGSLYTPWAMLALANRFASIRRRTPDPTQTRPRPPPLRQFRRNSGSTMGQKWHQRRGIWSTLPPRPRVNRLNNQNTTQRAIMTIAILATAVYIATLTIYPPARKLIRAKETARTNVNIIIISEKNKGPQATPK